MPDQAISGSEIDKHLQENFRRNQAYAKKGDYQTTLNPGSEQKFRAWLKTNGVPFDPKAKLSDYDMRGFWLALQSKDPRAVSAVNPNDKKLHYPDFWKTPYHATFSNESQWAVPGAPVWNKQDQLVMPNGSIVFDERARTMPTAQTSNAGKTAGGDVNALGTQGRYSSHRERE